MAFGPRDAAQRGFDHWVNTEDSYIRSHATEGYSAYYHYLVSRGYTPSDPHHDGLIFNRHTAARLPEAEGKPAYQAAEAIRFLETHRDRPFLLSVSFAEPHSPFTGPFDDLYAAEEMTLPESWYLSMDETVPLPVRRLREASAGGYMAQGQLGVRSNDELGWKELKTRYWGLCTLVDKYVGRILAGLAELGLADDTIVVYTSDHGHLLGEHRLLNKSVLYEPSAQIPLIIRAPGTAPRCVATPVSHVDLVPTLLDLLDRPLPEQLHGSSLAPLLREGDTDPDAAAVAIEWSGLAATELVNAARFLASLRTTATRRCGRSVVGAGSSTCLRAVNTSCMTYKPIRPSCAMLSAPPVAKTCAATCTLDCCVGNARRRIRSPCRRSDPSVPHPRPSPADSAVIIHAGCTRNTSDEKGYLVKACALSAGYC